MDDTRSFFTEIRAVAGGREDQIRAVMAVSADTADRMRELVGLHENLEIEDHRMETEVFALFVDASSRLDALEALDAEGGTPSADGTVYETVCESEAAFADYLDRLARAWRRCSEQPRSNRASPSDDGVLA